MSDIFKKGIFYSVIICTLAIFNSCSDVLKEVIYSELTPDNAFVTQEDAIAAVNGIYDPLHGITNRGIFFLNDVTTDAGFSRRSANCEYLEEINLSGNEDVRRSWQSYWRMIARANIAIDNISPMDEDRFDEGLKARLLSEAYFLRALSYYNLTDLFYTVPLVTDSNVEIDAILPPTPIDEIDAQIEKDLLSAKAALPLSYANQEAGRAAYGSAVAYLCRLHMRTAGRTRLNGGDATTSWNKALEHVNEILKLEQDGVYVLQPHLWENIFNPQSQAALYNKELIFVVRSNPNSVAGTTDIGMAFTPWEYDMGWDLIHIPLEFAWKFDKTDERYSELLVTEFPGVYNEPGWEEYYKIPASIDKVRTVYEEETYVEDDYYDVIYEMSSAYTKKYAYTKTWTYNYNTGNNMIMARLSDFILCKAEILNELNGPSAEAVNLINRVRERAFQNTAHNLKLADYGSKEALRSAICDERALELNLEGVRRPDLIRMGLWKNRLDEYVATIKLKSEWAEKNAGGNADFSSWWKVYPADLQEKDIRRYFPVPKRESDINPLLNDCRKF